MFISYLLLMDTLGNLIWFSSDTDGTDKVDQVRELRIYQSTCVFPERLLKPGQYLVSIGIIGKPLDAVQKEYHNVIIFKISDKGYTLHRNIAGIIAPYLTWEVERQQEDKTKIMG